MVGNSSSSNCSSGNCLLGEMETKADLGMVTRKQSWFLHVLLLLLNQFLPSCMWT
ncbi:hypothetical protein NC652_024286 [Populus alba x Populus x berolinensis]|nr:hypothetical protein NC652_024286 [Populus alba x Populus x berolinensis]